MDVAHWARRIEGVDHVTQTLACCHCRGLAGCGRIGSDLGLRLGRLARWMASLWMGRPAHRHRRPRLLRRLRLWRLLCAAPGPDALGAAVAAGEPLLLIEPVLPNPESPGPRRGFFYRLTEQISESVSEPSRMSGLRPETNMAVTT